MLYSIISKAHERHAAQLQHVTLMHWKRQMKYTVYEKALKYTVHVLWRILSIKILSASVCASVSMCALTKLVQNYLQGKNILQHSRHPYSHKYTQTHKHNWPWENFIMISQIQNMLINIHVFCDCVWAWVRVVGVVWVKESKTEIKWDIASVNVVCISVKQGWEIKLNIWGLKRNYD